MNWMRWWLGVGLACALVPGSARAACTFRVEASRLEVALDDALAAYASLDVAAFRKAMAEVDYMVPCLSEPAPVAVATALHRVRGIGQFVDGRPDDVLASMRAARVLDPDYRFAPEVLPVGFELRTQYEALDPAPGAAWRLARPKGGTLWMDGAPSQERPRDRAVLMQVIEQDGAVQQSRYLVPADPTPVYAGVNGRRFVVWSAAAATAVGAGALYGAAWATRGGLPDAGSNDELGAIKSQTNALTVGASALAVGAVVQGVWAVSMDATRSRGTAP